MLSKLNEHNVFSSLNVSHYHILIATYTSRVDGCTRLVLHNPGRSPDWFVSTYLTFHPGITKPQTSKVTGGLTLSNTSSFFQYLSSSVTLNRRPPLMCSFLQYSLFFFQNKKTPQNHNSFPIHSSFWSIYLLLHFPWRNNWCIVHASISPSLHTQTDTFNPLFNQM